MKKISFISCLFIFSSLAVAGEPVIALDINPSVYAGTKEGISLSGKRVDEFYISKPVNLPLNGAESETFTIGVLLKKKQKALFTAELQIRDSWNNSNSFNCVVKNRGNNTTLFGMNINAIEYNVNGTNHKTGSPITTSGVYKWSVIPANGEGALLMFDTVCKGWHYGYKPNLVLHLSRVVLE